MDTLDGMRAFIAVAREGSFTAAGRNEGRSTALMSKYVGQLEERLGVRLLERTTRSLRLTEVGRAYLERAEELIADFDELEGGLQSRTREPAGRLVVSAPVNFGESYIARVVACYVRRWPRVSVDLRLTDRFVNLIDEGVDVGIRIRDLPDSNMIARHLCAVPTVCCAAPAYLKERGRPDQPHGLSEHDCIVDTNMNNPRSWAFEVEGKRVQVPVAGRVSVNSARAARAMAVEGGGIGMIPSYAIADDLESGGLVPLLAEHNAFRLGLYAVYPHRQHLAAKTRAFVEALVTEFSATPAWAAIVG